MDEVLLPKNCQKCASDPAWFCADCGKNLYEFNPAYPAVEPHVAYDSLYLRVEGGYGMFFDTDFDTHPDVYGFYLCHECAHALCDHYPWLKKLLRNGHFHGFDAADKCITDFDGPVITEAADD